LLAFITITIMPAAASSTSGAASSSDMSTKIGGRVVTPALPVVDASGPSPKEVSFNDQLMEFCKDNVPLEPREGIQRRERVLNRMGALAREWVKTVCRKRGLPPDVAESAGGQLFTSGSYRLGVHEPGADIDIILVAPNVCSRQDFFGTIPSVVGEEEEPTKRDPDSLAERIRHHADVTNFVPVEGAAIPILTFDWEGVNIDLLFASLNTPTVPTDFDIDNDAVLDGVDSATEKSLNGPRVTNLIAALVSGTRERYQTFLAVVRCVRKWAKARGLYSNKMGYWGGVNINIGVALCCQLYPNTCPASLLRKFFLVFRTWRWPNPVMLTKPHDTGYGLQVWSPMAHNSRQVAPIITPAYPAMNSTMSISRQTLQIMHEEFCRGHEIVDRLWKEHQTNSDSNDDDGTTHKLDWSELFRPSDFFIAYPHYLSLCIVGPTQEDAQAWVAFVESRLRKLVSDMLGRSLPISKIQLWPKKVEACIADKTSLLTLGQRKNSATYMVGFKVDTLRMRGNQLNIELQMSHFREWELSRFQPLVPGMDVLVKIFECRNLPKICFEIYDSEGNNGKEIAMKRRRMQRDADPKRQERKRLRKLEALKAKMLEIQKRKEDKSKAIIAEEAEAEAEAAGAEVERKRKRSDADEGDDEASPEVNVVKLEETEETNEEEDEQPEDSAETNDVVAEEEEVEANLLESALDALQQGTEGGRTREEAEADRRKLLAGEGQEMAEEETDYVAADDEDLGYSLENARQAFMAQPKKQTGYRDIRSLTLAEEEAEILRKAGYTIVNDAETESRILGGNQPTPFREMLNAEPPKIGKFKIQFRSNFDIVELDANGHVIDKGDDDYMPSKTWTGRKAGFEFKLNDRGLGYYRTGKKVVVPSNTAY
jgi:poly(A) polymerase